MLLLDTHVLVWLVEGSQRLGSVALDKINQFWEIEMLIEKGRLEFNIEQNFKTIHLVQIHVENRG